MAEGLQRRIEYSDLKFISSFAMEKILDFQTYNQGCQRKFIKYLLSENSDTRIKLEWDSLGRVVKEWQDAHWISRKGMKRKRKN